MPEIRIDQHPHSVSVYSPAGASHVDRQKCRSIGHAVRVGLRGRIDEPLVCALVAVIAAADDHMQAAAERLQKAHARGTPADQRQLADARYRLLEAQAARDLAARTLEEWHAIERQIAREAKDT